ncbi:5'-deoxynucleotidase [Anaerocolumna aminovalerica]|uniref:5'-deoxynucleotidase n=2 Tax=Anaerocolumna aminovalerica TaxID=1527 RepID=A0A1I5DRM2_9FIRM|nr:5'-deoxynucleotidase [Anaerocolumna aminovalerica]MDU6266711.1 5'-deoxynucleotidase [Anaerocolumna aminovalerica]SFO01421.1 5'-deoxynucleotidase [Anaerocolumna aminovalerica]
MDSNFFAMMSRMKYIERWALMRNSQPENISEHTLEVSMLAHGLAVIGKRRLGSKADPEKTALVALFHDSTEIITGDMPTPIKYYNQEIQEAFKEIETFAANRLLAMLPVDLREEYENLFFPREGEEQMWKLVKAADKLSALIKCIQEEKAGNTEFASAKRTLTETLLKMNLKEVNIFMEEFLPAYYKTLDELNS